MNIVKKVVHARRPYAEYSESRLQGMRDFYVGALYTINMNGGKLPLAHPLCRAGIERYDDSEIGYYVADYRFYKQDDGITRVHVPEINYGEHSISDKDAVVNPAVIGYLYMQINLLTKEISRREKRAVRR